jgi:hypothetical protein
MLGNYGIAMQLVASQVVLGLREFVGSAFRWRDKDE